MSIPVGNSWSVGMDYYFPWIWPPEKNRWCIELLGVGLEARYWFGRSRTWQQRLTGHSVGLGVNAGYYDLERNWKGAQGEYVSAGVDYTYALPVGKRKNVRFEFSIGVGYIRSWARPYEVKEPYGDLVRDEQELIIDMIAPTKAAVSVVIPVFRKVDTERRARR